MARGELRIPGSDDEPDPQDQVDEAAAFFGLVPDQPVEVEEEFYLWPENVPVFNLFRSLQTQWQSGMNGTTGFNYAGVEAYMRMKGVKRKDQAELLPGLQVMEAASLREWALMKQQQTD